MDVLRTVSSFVFSFSVACVFAVIAGINEIFDRLFYPVVVTFPMLFSAVYGAVKNRDKKLDEMSKVFGVGKGQRLFKMIIPDVWKRLFPQFCSILSFNVKLIVAGEALAYTATSLGRELKIANANSEIAKLLAISVVVILIAVFLEAVVKLSAKIIGGIIYERDRKRIEQALR